MAVGKWEYDSTVARIAGNILSGMMLPGHLPALADEVGLAQVAVKMAREIIAETKRTQPACNPERP